MTKKEIVYPDADAGTEEQIDSGLRLDLELVGNFKLYSDAPENNEIFIERIRNAHAIVLGWNLPNEVMLEAKELEIISFTGIGVQKFVDMQSARERGITVCNSPGYGDNAVAAASMYAIINIEGPQSTYKDSLAYMYFNDAKYISSFLVTNDILKYKPDNLELLEINAISVENMGALEKAVEVYSNLLSKTKKNKYTKKVSLLAHFYRYVILIIFFLLSASNKK